MAQRAASYGEAVLHKGLTMKHCFRLHFITPRQAAKAPQYEASPVFISLRRGKPFHSAMKHSLRSYDEKMKNESFHFFAQMGKKNTKPSGFAPCGDSCSSLKKRSFFFTSSPVLDSALKWTTNWTTIKENVFHGSRNPESRQA